MEGFLTLILVGIFFVFVGYLFEICLDKFSPDRQRDKRIKEYRFQTFDDIVKTLALPRGPQRFRLIPAMMGHDEQKKWLNNVINHANN